MVHIAEVKLSLCVLDLPEGNSVCVIILSFPKAGLDRLHYFSCANVKLDFDQDASEGNANESARDNVISDLRFL